MHKGYIHIISQITLFLGKYLAWSAVCVSVPLQPYIVEICDSLRGKIFQKFIERWDSGVGGCEHSVEQSANVLLNPHFPSPPPPQSDKFTRFCQWKNVELNIHVSTHFCVCFHWEWSGNTGGTFGDVRHKAGILKKSIILGAAAGTRASHLCLCFTSQFLSPCLQSSQTCSESV